MGNPIIMDINRKATIMKLRSVKDPQKILVVADLNIGDAVNLQATVAALRDFFPYASLDYVIADCAKILIAGNPEITHVFPVFTGRPLPNENDRNELKRITKETKYDVIFNFCPFFNERKDFNGPGVVIGYTGMAHRMMHIETHSFGTNHIVSQAYRYVRDICSKVFIPIRNESFTGVGVTLPDSAVLKAREFYFTLEGFDFGFPLIYFNPDASSVFTLVPLEVQAEILHDLIYKFDCRIFLGRGYTFPKREIDLIKTLPKSRVNRIAVVPDFLGLEGTAALIDSCDAYVGGDTGPLHIASAKKTSNSGKSLFVNRTAVYSIFGATPARMYGYDSERVGFFPSNQKAQSRVFISKSICRNMTCINKRAKTCKEIHCFDGLDTREILDGITENLYHRQQCFVQLAVA